MSPVRLIDGEGEQRGLVPTDEALTMARQAGLDLVEVSPNERPPVCKIMDYGKHRYLQSKKQKQKHHEQRLKEVRLRPKTDPHDKEIKLGRARGFLEQGIRVQFTMMFRGRERFHRGVGLAIFDDIVAALEDVAKLERPARSLGRRMTMVLVPTKVVAPVKPKAAKAAKAAKAPRAPETRDATRKEESAPRPAGSAVTPAAPRDDRGGRPSAASLPPESEAPPAAPRDDPGAENEIIAPEAAAASNGSRQ